MLNEWLIFGGFFGGLFVVRIIVATIVFCWLLPEGDRCPLCDAHTLRVESRWWNRLAPWLRTRWCLDCGWEGLQRPGEVGGAPAVAPAGVGAGARARK